MNPPATRACPDCGAENAVEANACAACRRPLAPMATSRPRPEPARPAAGLRPPQWPARSAGGSTLAGAPQIVEEPGKIIRRRRHARMGLFGIGAGPSPPPGSAPSWTWLLVGAGALVIAGFAVISITLQKPPLSIPGATPEQLAIADSLVRVLGRDSLDLGANVALGNLLYDTHSYGEAVRHYRRALSLRPDLPDVRVDLATSLHHSGHGPEAVTELRQVIAAHPGHVNARVNLGVIHAALGELAEAESAYRAAAALPLTPAQRDFMARQLAEVESRRKAAAAAPPAGSP